MRSWSMEAWYLSISSLSSFHLSLIAQKHDLFCWQCSMVTMNLVTCHQAWLWAQSLLGSGRVSSYKLHTHFTIMVIVINTFWMGHQCHHSPPVIMKFAKNKHEMKYIFGTRYEMFVHSGSDPHSLHGPGPGPPLSPGHGGGLLHLQGPGGVWRRGGQGDKEDCQSLYRGQDKDEGEEEVWAARSNGMHQWWYMLSTDRGRWVDSY